jgi:hypothetical protein
MRKARVWRAFSSRKENSPKTRMPGWRRSADRTRLHANSLLTGNFTGKFAILVPQKPISLHETAVLQRLFDQFPTQINRENISKNREFLAVNREFHLQNDKMKMQIAAPPRATRRWFTAPFL